MANYDFVLNAENPTGTPPFTYTWTITDGNGMTIPYWESSDGDSVIIDGTTMQNSYGCIIYELCMTDNTGCSTCIGDTSAANVPSPCTSTFTSTIIGPNTVSITINSNMPQFYIVDQFVQWTDGDGQAQMVPYMGPGAGITYNPGPNPTSDKFYCCVQTFFQSGGGCLYCDSIQYTTTLGIENISAETISLSPNPTNSIVNVVSPAHIDAIKIFNLLNQEISTNTILNDKSAIIDLTNQNKGMYLIKIYTSNDIVEKKIIKK